MKESVLWREREGGREGGRECNGKYLERIRRGGEKLTRWLVPDNRLTTFGT